MNKKNRHRVVWDNVELSPSIQIKTGIRRKVLTLSCQDNSNRDQINFDNELVQLKGKWDNSPGFGSLLSLKLTNKTKKSLRITRLVFPTENGIQSFLQDFKPKNLSFLRNGYQSWSTARSYRLKEKPLRPWLQLVSLASSNMANLPSNTPGNLSSEMYSVISNLANGDAFIVGQCAPFNHFFYIRLKVSTLPRTRSYFELVFDFGRKMLLPGETIKLDGIIMAIGTISELEENYFDYVKKTMGIKIPKTNVRGWCTWYQYFNRIKPDDIYKNLEVFDRHNVPIDFVQLDDGYQKKVGDWLNLTPQFNGEMKKLADRIRKSGYKPGIWIAPFIADISSELVKIHPEYILRNEYGKPLVAGYNPLWPGKFYYGLDITNPRFKEYIKHVIDIMVHEWGFEYLKLDFLFAGCLRGGTHHNLELSRSEVLKSGIEMIRKVAGKKNSTGWLRYAFINRIGQVNAMRVGPDTAPYWKKMVGAFLQTGAMIGARNSLRNFMVRSLMHKRLWLNDPDCIMIRKSGTRLNENERLLQINAIIISGGILLFSDDFTSFDDEQFDEIDQINEMSEACFQGTAIACDLMEQEIPEIYFNTSGFLGVFNFKKAAVSRMIDFKKYIAIKKVITKLQDQWTGEIYDIEDQVLHLSNIEPHSSFLFKILEDE